MNQAAVLYTREGCGLCEQAQALAQSINLTLTPVNIAGNLDLLERYGNHIPVVKYGDSELFWPFSGDDLVALIAS
ncbi:MAG: glutaredoxin family protein [Lysobacterales bacterium]